MKKLVFLMATLLIGSMVFTGCKKDNQDTPTEPTENSFKVSYKLGNQREVMGINYVTSNCFKFDVTYTGADGKAVELKGVSLPWASEPFEAKASFKASLEAKAVYTEAELPDSLVYGALGAILRDTSVVAKSGEIGDYNKANFLQMIADEPEQLYTKVNFDF